MARSRAVVVAAVAAALLGSVASGWWLGGSDPAVVPVTVVHVVDGDTLIAAFADGHTETVRVLGIDTPETVDPRKPVQCFGPEASAYASIWSLVNVTVRTLKTGSRTAPSTGKGLGPRGRWCRSRS